MIDRELNVIMRVAQNESKGNFCAFNPNDNNAGVSFGLIQFNQKKGSLSTLLQRMYKLDKAHFIYAFGVPTFNKLFQDSMPDNLEEIKEIDFSESKASFIQLGKYEPFQQLQLELAEEEYFTPAFKIGEQYDLLNTKALACIMDSCVQNGVGGTRKLMSQAKGNIKTFAVLADANKYADNRRQNILSDKSLSEVYWASNNIEINVQDILKQLGLAFVAEFQDLHRLAPDGIVGAKTTHMLSLHARPIGRIESLVDVKDVLRQEIEKLKEARLDQDGLDELVTTTYISAFNKVLGAMS